MNLLNDHGFAGGVSHQSNDCLEELAGGSDLFASNDAHRETCEGR